MHTHTIRAAIAGALLAAVAIPAIAARTDAPAKPAVVTITAKDFAFDAPDTIIAGATVLQLVNKGTELHHIQVARLDSGKTAADLAAAMKNPGPPPAWFVEIGGPNAVVPGASSETTVSLTPGNYVLLCFVPGPDGMPHVMKGMVRPLTVAPATNGIALMPKGDMTITLRDYGFEFSKPLTAGRHQVLVTNAAQQPHEIVVVRLAPGKTPADVAAWVEKMDGPPPGAPIGGTTAIASGGSNVATLDLTPGEYGLLCFINDAKDGKPHVAHGMMHQFTVR